MRKKVVLLILGLLLLLFCGGYATVYASDNETTADVSELIDNLDLSALDEYLASLGEICGGEVGLSAGEYLKAVINGDKNFDIDMLVSLVFSSLSQTRNLVSIASLLISICIIWSLVSGIEFKNNTNSAKKAVNIACFSIMSVIVLYWLYSLVRDAGRFFDDIQRLCNAVFPIFLTLLSASGAASSASALSPAAALFSVTLISIVKNFVLPVAIAVLVLSVVGNIGEDMPLGGLAGALESVAGWVIKTGFFVFAAFLGTQGMFTGINDSVSLRLGKFALSKYVPIIGGYLSDGFNYVLAGSVVIKNALGITCVIMIFIRALPVFVSLVMASLTLKMTAAVAEPLGISAAANALSKAESSIKIVRAAVIGCAFLLIIFIAAVMMCGNTVL